MIVGRRMSHPRVLVSVCIDSGQTPGAALLVVRTGPSNGARFELDRRSFGSGATQAAIIQSVAERIPRDATVLLRTPRMQDHALRHSIILGRSLPSHPPALITRYRPDLRTICLPYERRELADAAAAYGIVAERDSMWTPSEAKAAMRRLCGSPSCGPTAGRNSGNGWLRHGKRGARSSGHTRHRVESRTGPLRREV